MRHSFIKGVKYYIYMIQSVTQSVITLLNLISKYGRTWNKRFHKIVKEYISCEIFHIKQIFHFISIPEERNLVAEKLDKSLKFYHHSFKTDNNLIFPLKDYKSFFHEKGENNKLFMKEVKYENFLQEKCLCAYKKIC